MKLSFFKFFLIATFISCGISFSSCSDNENEVEDILTFNKLPAQAQSFINKFFNGYTIYKIEEIDEEDIYQVSLEDGYIVDFNKAGNWVQVMAQPSTKSIPYGIVPAVIQEYLDKNYSGYDVNLITHTGNGYDVNLVTGLRLYFNEAGEMIQIGTEY